jgi:hypothetical protein
MNYDDITLSTLAGLSAWEKEINRLAGKTEIWSLRSESETEPYTLTFSGDVTSARAKTAEGNVIDIPVEENDMAIPMDTIIELVAYNGDAEAGKFPLNEAKSLVLHSDTELTATLSSKSAWFLATINYTWQDKIDLAKKILKQDIVTDILARYPAIESDAEAIALVTNPEIFAIASDMKTLNLIYADLANSGYNQLYQAKAESYAQRYSHEKDKAMSAMRLAGYEGDTIGSRAFFGGNIVK